MRPTHNPSRDVSKRSLSSSCHSSIAATDLFVHFLHNRRFIFLRSSAVQAGMKEIGEIAVEAFGDASVNRSSRVEQLFRLLHDEHERLANAASRMLIAIQCFACRLRRGATSIASSK